jgi:hypothetical protein
LQAIFNPLPWVMTLWYWKEKTFLNSLPAFVLHHLQNTVCQPFVSSIDESLKGFESIALFWLYAFLTVFYFFWYWKTSKPKWVCWCLHMLVWILLLLLGTTYEQLWSD